MLTRLECNFACFANFSYAANDVLHQAKQASWIENPK